jgi:hypothetical protein
MDCVKRYIYRFETNEFTYGAVYINNVLYKKIYLKEELDVYKCKNLKSINDNVYISFYDINDEKYYLPTHHDFSYLMDYKDIVINDKVYVYDDNEVRLYTVRTIDNTIRENGLYDYYEYEANSMNHIKCVDTKIYFNKHKATIFRVDETDKTFIWEDYNYHQSYLSEKYIKFKEML